MSEVNTEAMSNLSDSVANVTSTLSKSETAKVIVMYSAVAYVGYRVVRRALRTRARRQAKKNTEK